MENKLEASHDKKNEYDLKKIILMSRLAVYDKHYGDADRKKEAYFRHDYIYRQNIWVRFFAAIGCVIVIFFYIMHKIVIDNIDILEIDYRSEAINIAIFVGVVLIAYSLIGTMKYTVEYEKSRNRLKRYYRLLDKINGLDETE